MKEAQVEQFWIWYIIEIINQTWTSKKVDMLTISLKTKLCLEFGQIFSLTCTLIVGCELLSILICQRIRPNIRQNRGWQKWQWQNTKHSSVFITNIYWSQYTSIYFLVSGILPTALKLAEIKESTCPYSITIVFGILVYLVQCPIIDRRFRT